ncbi:MAG TPA: hypothetical protein ENK23_06260 [Sorangium sp.]|nr:hypothetical protein [Sorangium sp.]
MLSVRAQFPCSHLAVRVMAPCMDPTELRATHTIVTHADCPDGIASAMILKDVLPKARVVFVEHNTPEQRNLVATAGVLFCDIAPPPARNDEFVAAGAMVLDHHRGAREQVLAFGPRGVFADEQRDPGVSGALLAYREVWCRLNNRRDQAIEQFVTLAGIRDTWQKHDERWQQACAQASALAFYGYEVLAGATGLTPQQQHVGRMLIDKRQQAAAAIAAGKLYRVRDDVAMYNDRDKLLSDVAEAAFMKNERLNIVCGFHYKVNSDGRMLLVCAMRSRRGAVDVSAICKAQGGGGHVNAAGFGVEVSAEMPNPVTVLRAALAM